MHFTMCTLSIKEGDILCLHVGSKTQNGGGGGGGGGGEGGG